MPARVATTMPMPDMPAYVAVFIPAIETHRSPLGQSCNVVYNPEDSTWYLTCNVRIGAIRSGFFALHQPIAETDAEDPTMVIDLLAGHVLHHIQHFGHALVRLSADLDSVADVEGLRSVLHDIESRLGLDQLFEITSSTAMPMLQDGFAIGVTVPFFARRFHTIYTYALPVGVGEPINARMVIEAVAHGVLGMAESIRQGVPQYSFCRDSA